MNEKQPEKIIITSVPALKQNWVFEEYKKRLQDQSEKNSDYFIIGFDLATQPDHTHILLQAREEWRRDTGRRFI